MTPLRAFYILLVGDLMAKGLKGQQALFTAFSDGMPYEWYTKYDITQYKWYYASVFYA